MFSLSVAWQLQEQNRLGSLERGKAADLIVIEQNLFEIPVHDIIETRVDLTVVEGRVVFQR